VRAGVATLTTVNWDATDHASFDTALKVANKMKDAGKTLA